MLLLQTFAKSKHEDFKFESKFEKLKFWLQFWLQWIFCTAHFTVYVVAYLVSTHVLTDIRSCRVSVHLMTLQVASDPTQLNVKQHTSHITFLLVFHFTIRFLVSFHLNLLNHTLFLTISFHVSYAHDNFHWWWLYDEVLFDFKYFLQVIESQSTPAIIPIKAKKDK